MLVVVIGYTQSLVGSVEYSPTENGEGCSTLYIMFVPGLKGMLATIDGHGMVFLFHTAIGLAPLQCAVETPAPPDSHDDAVTQDQD